ncbi:Mor transcription activator family protein [Burkholderia anthina]|uniref:Mor transcription activator family protein n=1 Tax=Burkholderia anthina TaxID=179879 RepID=UPI001AA08366|nr:Mor transcription activator family protein [Burkholderia anthina]QTD95628.1 hypothetical protein J4G50_38990 [Burkholderia anthina]QTD95650.1 hypothetical protein J4G50_39120 [Burkholderia anthina]
MDIETYQPIDIKKLTLQALAPLHALFDPAMKDRQRELAEAIFTGLINSAAARSCSADEMAKTAMAVLFQISHSCGGQNFYLAKIDNLFLDRKYRAIRAKFNGRNHRQLAVEFGLTEMRVRQILSDKAG